MSPLVPLAYLAGVVATDLWVYLDAAAHENQGHPVVLWIGSFTFETPVTWCLACLLV